MAINQANQQLNSMPTDERRFEQRRIPGQEEAKKPAATQPRGDRRANDVPAFLNNQQN